MHPLAAYGGSALLKLRKLVGFAFQNCSAKVLSGFSFKIVKMHSTRPNYNRHSVLILQCENSNTAEGQRFTFVHA